jgi:hypothetical protein
LPVQSARAKKLNDFIKMGKSVSVQHEIKIESSCGAFKGKDAMRAMLEWRCGLPHPRSPKKNLRIARMTRDGGNSRSVEEEAPRLQPERRFA